MGPRQMRLVGWRLSMTPDRIKSVIDHHLAGNKELPCRVDEMTPREFEISKLLSEDRGMLMFLSDNATK